MARFATKCVSVSLSEAELRQFGFDEAFIRVHQLFSAGLENVQHIGHNSRTFDFAGLPERFDLTFVDGDHSYEAIKADTRSAFTMRRDERSVIVWHDYGSTTERVRWNTLAGILDGCPAELRGHLYHVSNTLCAVYLPPAFAVGRRDQLYQLPGVAEQALSGHRVGAEEVKRRTCKRSNLPQRTHRFVTA